MAAPAATARPTLLDTLGWVTCSLVAISAVICLWLEPIHHDGWYFWTALQADSFSFWETVKANYLGGNPRFGENVTVLLYGVGGARVIISTLLILGCFWLLTVCALGRRPTRHDGVVVATLVAAVLVAVPRVGPMHFYRPFFGNYVVGAMPAFALLAMWRSHLQTSWSPPAWALPGLVVLAAIAGLGNEHTGPAFIVLGLGACVWCFRRGQLRMWMVATVGALVVGYLLLYFAPGQMQRYEGAGRAGPVDNLLSRSFTENATLAFRGLTPVIVLAPWLALLLGAQHRQFFSRRTLANEKAFFAVAAAFALAAATVLLASPKTGARLYYAGAALLSAATAAFVVSGVHGRWRIAVAGLNTLVVAVSAVGLVVTNYKAHLAYEQRWTQVVGAPRQSEVVLTPLTLRPRHWVMPDDLRSDHHLRQRLIDHFQLSTLRVSADEP